MYIKSYQFLYLFNQTTVLANEAVRLGLNRKPSVNSYSRHFTSQPTGSDKQCTELCQMN